MVVEIDDVIFGDYGKDDFLSKSIIRSEHIKHIYRYNTLRKCWSVIMDNTDYVFHVYKEGYELLKSAMSAEKNSLPGNIKM
jgi:hypothetical protein